MKEHEDTITLTLRRNDLDNALRCLQTFSEDPREPQRYRAIYARSYQAIVAAAK